MNFTASLSFRIALIFSLVITAVLATMFVTIEFRFRADIGNFTTAENLQVTRARADQVGVLLEKIIWQAKMVAHRPEIQNLAKDPQAAQPVILGLNDQLSKEILGCLLADQTGNYFSSANKTGSIADRDYFAKIINEGLDSFIGAPVISKSLGVPIVVVAVAVKDPDGATIGLVGAQVALKDLSDITSQIKVGQNGYGWIITQAGLVIAHQDPQAIMNLIVTDADKDGYNGLNALGARMVTDESGTGNFIGPDKQDITTYYVRIPQSPGWVLGINVPTAEVNETMRQLTLLLLLLLGAGVGVTVAIAIIVGRSIAKPIKLAAREFRHLAQGEADLSHELAVLSKDEVGSMVRDFNAFIANLRQMVVRLKNIQQELGGIGQGLEGSIQSTHAAISQMNDSIAKVRQESAYQSDSVGESSSAVEEIAKNIESLDQLITDQSASIIEASASIEEMVGNIASIGTSTDQMADEFDGLSEAAAEGKNTQSLAMEKINTIADRSAGLLEANKVIADIASQTNLLAMNAAIEAAHAGEAGKGFAVVAEEIRRLAETAAEQSRTISSEMTGVQTAISEVVISSKDSEEAFEKVASRIRETDKLVRQVRQAMTEQEEGSSQILVALKSMNEVTSQVRLGSSEMKSGNQTILSEIQRLKSSTADISLTMETLVKNTESINQNSSQVQEMSAHTAKSIHELDETIGRFKT